MSASRVILSIALFAIALVLFVVFLLMYMGVL